ncbi:MAG TPA: hypothetical protein VMH28_34430 [Candidatus Acidoferrales bacterium]|nr:hypothetical protein [Candidatus Acidoferrales bacterium]
MAKTLFVCLLILTAPLCAQKKIYPERWVYVSGELGSDRAVEQFRDIARTASEHGLTAILFSSGFDRLDLQPPENIARLKEVKSICERYHLELVPSMFGTGYGGGILSHDKNLAEGLLAKDALFVVEGGVARFSPENSASFGNGGFEEHQGDRPDGYVPGVKTAIESTVFHSGKVSLRLEGFGAKPDDSAHIAQEITVRPYRQYKLSMWVKTEDVKPAVLGGIHAFSDDGRSLHPWEPRISGTSDWHQLVSGFNSSSATKFKLDIGIFEAAKGATGKVWIDDVKVEEVGLLNVLRRAGTPVTVRDEKTGTVYEEGKDYAPIADPELNFRWNHDGPAVRILPEGRIKDGARLRLSYYHGTTIYQSQVPVCLSEPKAQEIWDRCAHLIHDLLAPRKYMMAMDEMRMANSCETCKRRGLTAAELVGTATTRQFNAIRAIDPKAEVYVWSDMYDPNHNARNHYYLVEGDITGSWNYIPKELRMVCWYYERRQPSLAHFSKLGFQILAGAYYDGNTLDNPKGWLETLDETPGAIGIMYTTWQNKYGLLADFGDLVSKR